VALQTAEKCRKFGVNGKNRYLCGIELLTKTKNVLHRSVAIINKTDKMTTVALRNLLTYIETLGLSSKNRKWLSEKLIEPTKSKTIESGKKGSLRHAFVGDWGKDQDSINYAQTLREESVINNREVPSW